MGHSIQRVQGEKIDHVKLEEEVAALMQDEDVTNKKVSTNTF